MDASYLTQQLKGLLSIRAVLRKASVTEPYYYSASCRQRPLKANAVGPLANALRETASELVALAETLEPQP